MSSIRVSICDDVRELRALIRFHVDAEADLEVVSESSNGVAALRDVAPETRVVVLSGLTLDRVRAEASRLGAVRFVDKSLPMSALVDAVRAVAASLPSA